MKVTARNATPDDVDELTRLYRLNEAEQGELRPLWPIADGVDEPIRESLAAIVAEDRSVMLVGEIDGATVGFLWARPEPLLVQAEGEEVGVIRLIFTEPDARGVGVGDVMITRALDALRADGLRYFDARVSPGHRQAKNFFESNGFKARLIFMHRDDRSADE